MPRKKIPSPKEVREWLEWRENGTSEVAIARKTGRDIRTIRAGLQKATDERRLNLAQIELLRNALKLHQEQLMGAVDWLQQSNTLPLRDLYVQWRTEIEESSSSKGAEPPPAVALLKEHLPKDQLWTRLESWQKISKNYIDSLIRFKQIAAEKLKQRTGGVFVDANFNPIEDAPTVEEGVKLVATNVLELAYSRSIDRVFGIKPRLMEKIEERIQLDTRNGEVRLGPGHTLAVCPRQEEACRSSILSVLEELPTTPEAKKIASSWDELAAAKTQLDEALQEIKLSLLITGQCRICKRLKG
ncbi:hypothetical protein DEALK_02770 [Dehalogenimonas alkenigignens]|uniref:Uncharacterized protein n=1 Tax=Dehalogenimonas alkenigignens TaxID=1217799 RepID=A0A0W0GFV8_9CHLR|nr:hypothetical protein [Dehalogenimonas alkenigignens]KTB47432.1 hypothetical protein DEALK_02770 [Dehalogenimonas alkenigignens]